MEAFVPTVLVDLYCLAVSVDIEKVKTHTRRPTRKSAASKAKKTRHEEACTSKIVLFFVSHANEIE